MDTSPWILTTSPVHAHFIKSRSFISAFFAVANLKSSVETADGAAAVPVAIDSLTFGIGYNF
jgi:hypothetical protein